MRTVEEPGAERREWTATSRRRIPKAALAVTAGAFLAVGLSIAPAGAATLQPDTLKTCETGSNNAYEYIGWCDGTGPTSYRVLATCADNEGVYGVTRWDGDRRESTASCEINGLNSTLLSNWGYVLCSTSNGAGTYQGYVDKHGDISSVLLTWGNGNIATGGNLMCQYDVSQENNFNLGVAP